jgi:nitroreductase
MSETRSLGLRLRQAMPQPAKRVYQVSRELLAGGNAWFYDAMRFARFSGALQRQTSTAARKAEITKFYHMIEKGMALPAPRPGFGELAIQALCEKVHRAVADKIHDPEVRHAIDAIDGYRRFNEVQGVANPPWIGETLSAAARHGLVPDTEPVRAPRAPSPATAQDNLDFITSRHSVRHFSEEPVPEEVLAKAAMAAQSAPCVCNRQASRVYFARDPKMRRDLLACQNGNRGFGETAPVVAVITVDLRSFLNASERYQAWIDGGLFAMNLLLGFHAQGYGACCLNWSALPGQDRRLRKLGVVPDWETVIMMVAVGGLRKEFAVARSERHALSDVMRLI